MPRVLALSGIALGLAVVGMSVVFSSMAEGAPVVPLVGILLTGASAFLLARGSRGWTRRLAWAGTAGAALLAPLLLTVTFSDVDLFTVFYLLPPAMLGFPLMVLGGGAAFVSALASR